MMSITQLLKLPGQSPSIKRLLKSRLQRSVKIRCCGAAVNKEIRASNKRAFIAHQQLCHIGHLIGGSRAACRAFSEHIFIEISTWTVKLIYCQRVTIMPGEMELIRVFDLFRLKDIQLQKFLCRYTGKHFTSNVCFLTYDQIMIVSKAPGSY